MSKKKPLPLREAAHSQCPSYAKKLAGQPLLCVWLANLARIKH